MADGARKLRVSVISPEAVGFEGEAESVVAPAHDGLLGVLRGHAPMMVLLGRGDVAIRDGGETRRFRVSGGFLQVLDDEVQVLVEEIGPSRST
ncbi:MAG: F0F1 ATP synthase subunit epsilon [Gemmatimonadota bacterium]